jgi:hypothetical protein
MQAAWQLFDALQVLVASIGPATVRATKSQVAFSRRRVFAWVWMPGQYLRHPAAPLVLTVALPARDASPRWKQVVEPAKGRFVHHLELWNSADLDGAVADWLRQAWEAAG